VSGEPRVPLAKPCFDQAELEAVRRVLDRGWVVQGPEVEAFEARLAALHGVRHAIAVASGTAALHVAYLALGVSPGDALFIPSFAWPSAANLAMQMGARPVLVDVLPETYNLDPADLERQIQRCSRLGWGRPRAVVAVHQFGLAADLEAISAVAGAHGLELIEDAACALGAWCGVRPVGGVGRAGTLSFHPRKAVTTGEGGAVLTEDDALARACRVWRNHGQTPPGGPRDLSVPGFNYRLTDLQAAIGQVQLDKLPALGAARRRVAAQYLSALAGYPEIALPASPPEHTWQTFMVVCRDASRRDELIRDLAEQGFGAGPGSIAAHLMTVYRERLEIAPEDLLVSAMLHRAGLALPLHHEVREADVARIAERLML
jgi:dTDP-4-amino-4,6-dideoxygalactose transaminase